MGTEPPKPKRKRRWFRFSLKTFVVVLTVFCVWLGLLVYRVNKQKEAVQWVKDHGGRAYYDFEFKPPKGVFYNAEPPSPEWLRELIGIDYFADVVLVSRYASKVEDVEPLRKLTELQWLTLRRTAVSDLEPLRELTQFCVLFLSDTQVSNLGPLRELTKLQALDLDGTQVSDLEPLRELTQLEYLWLGGTQVSDLEPLVGMKDVTIFLHEGQQVNVLAELKDRVKRE